MYAFSISPHFFTFLLLHIFLLNMAFWNNSADVIKVQYYYVKQLKWTNEPKTIKEKNKTTTKKTEQKIGDVFFRENPELYSL